MTIPNPAVLGLDNIGFLASDRDATYAVFEALGFTLSPLGRQILFIDGQPPQPWGTGSRCVNFANNAYFEIMGIVESGRPSGFYEAMLQNGAGNTYPKITVRIRSAESEVRRMRDVGRTAADPLRYLRVFAVEDNRPVGALMDLARYDTGEMGTCAVVATQHFTPEMTFYPSTLLHPNSAVSLAAVVVAHPSSEQAMAALSECMEYPAIGSRMILPDNGIIELVEPGDLPTDYPLCDANIAAPRIIAAKVGVTDIDCAAGWVAQSGRSHCRVGDELHVDIGGDAGVCLVFVPVAKA